MLQSSEIQGLTLTRWFLLYRLGLAMALTLLHVTDYSPANLGSHDLALYGGTVTVYLALCGLALLLSFTGSIDSAASNHLAVFVDIPAIGLLAYASGGVVSGLGTLTAISIAIGSLGFGGRIALLYAAMATLEVITEQVYAQLTGEFPRTAYSHAAGLGLAFFAIAILAHFLSARLRATELRATRQESAITDLSQLSDYVMHHMETGVLLVGTDTRVHRSNQAACQLLGSPKAERGEMLARFSPQLAQAVEDWRGRPDDGQLRRQVNSGEQTLQVAFLPIGRAGNSGTLLFLEDASRVAEQAQRLKLASLGQLTASIAHEIRNPLGAMSHAAQLLNESEALPQPDRRLVEIINDNVKRINGTVESVLRLSRRSPPNPRAIALEMLLEDIQQEVIGMYRLENRQLHCKIEPADCLVHADRDQVIQVLRILVDNSVRHFDRKLEDLRIEFSGGQNPGESRAFLEIADNGKGITGESTQRIFEPFFTTGSQGTGLGLYIARELSEANRILLSYRPNQPRGSRFKMSFSMSETDSVPMPTRDTGWAYPASGETAPTRAAPRPMADKNS